MAKIEVLLPKMGESVAEATIIKWVKQVGDLIEIDESVLEIATDKVDSEVPSPVAGKLIKLLYKEEDVVQVGAVIAVICSGVKFILFSDLIAQSLCLQVEQDTFVQIGNTYKVGKLWR